mgnify:CR=1 FL=1
MKIESIEYDDMVKAWDNLIEPPKGYDPSESASSFSMFDFIEEDGEDMVRPFIDFLDPRPIHKGLIKVTIQDWAATSTIMKNPKWPEVANFFHYNNDGHHIFLESITVGKTEIVLGSGS